MAVTVADLAISLRISADGADVDAAQVAVLTRLQGVGQSFVDLLIPNAPDPIKDEAIIRMAAYLYDQPLGRRDAYANSWVNSGAGSLATLWREQHAAAQPGTEAGSS